MAGNALRAMLIPEKVFSESFAPPFPDYFPPFVKEAYFAILESMFLRLSQQNPGFDFASLRTEIDFGKKWLSGDLSDTRNDISTGDWWEAEVAMIYILARCEHAATLGNDECNRWIVGEVWESVAKYLDHLNSRPEVQDRHAFTALYKIHIKNITCVDDLDNFPELAKYRKLSIKNIAGEGYSDEVLIDWMKKVTGNKMRGPGRPKGGKQVKISTSGRGDDTGMFKGGYP